jgi:hypothetical protein
MFYITETSFCENYENKVASRGIFHKILRHYSFLSRNSIYQNFAMKAIPLVKLLLMTVLVAWMQVLTPAAHASTEVLANAPTTDVARTAKTMGVPETSSVVLISAVGIMLMLRRRSLHA